MLREIEDLRLEERKWREGGYKICFTVPRAFDDAFNLKNNDGERSFLFSLLYFCFHYNIFHCNKKFVYFVDNYSNLRTLKRGRTNAGEETRDETILTSFLRYFVEVHSRILVD